MNGRAIVSIQDLCTKPNRAIQVKMPILHPGRELLWKVELSS
jgi:hypothetical protein